LFLAKKQRAVWEEKPRPPVSISAAYVKIQKSMHKKVLFWVLLTLGLLVSGRSFAQTELQANLSLLNSENFPEISAYLNVYHADGRAVDDLQPADILIVENDQVIPVSQLNYQQIGTQFVVAINPGPSFAIRNSQGTSRYDQVAAALRNWINTYPATAQDDLSLITTTGSRLSHQSDPADWLETFDTYQPDLRNSTPNFDLLNEAINLAEDIPPAPGMGKAVLFITPPLDQGTISGLPDLGQRARQAGIRLFFWLIASDPQLNTTEANQLAELAFQTGGTTFRFSGEQAFPEIESYLDPLRGVYQLSYLSAARTSSTYQVSARVNVQGASVESAPLTMDLQVLPPNPVFIQPPVEIERRTPETEEVITALIPSAQTLQILIEFPDGHPRQLIRSTLLVNGEIVIEHTQPPFDTFTWDITPYTQTGEQVLQVIVEDTLGLIGESIQTPVLISIAGQATGFAAVLVKQAPLIAILAALIAGVILLWVLVVGGRLRPADATRPRTRQRLNKDPVTQPVKILQENEHISPADRLVNLAGRFRWPQKRQSVQPFAYLDLLGDGNGDSRGVPQPITEAEVTFGRASGRVTHPLEDASVSDLHTRLVQKTNGECWIYDLGSTAGTWVNYVPVADDGICLEHGDLIHIGRVGYRFRFPGEQRARRIVIVKETKPQ
jgi:hypothetical protein